MNAALFRAVLASNLLSLMAGYCIGVVHRAVPYMEMEFMISEGLQAWALNSLLLGAVFGALFTGRPADFRGRRPVMTAISLIFLFSILATGVISNFLVFCFFRFITGIAIGGVSVLIPVYLSELAPASGRGRIVLSFPLALITGILFAFLADYWLRDTGANNWRYMILCGSFPALLFLIFRIFLPESPRFLMQRGLEQETDVVLGRIDPDADKFIFRQEYKRTIDMKILWKTSRLFEPPLIKSILFCILAGMMCSLTGIHSVVYYAADLAGSAGINQSSLSWPGLISGITCICSIIIILFFIDKKGRRRLILTGTLGIAICLLILSAINMSGISGGLIPYVVLAVYFGFLSGSMATIIWVILPEMFSNTVRLRGVSYGITSFWFFNFLTSLLVPVLSGTSVIGIALIIYGALTLFSFFFFRKNLPEGKGRALEEIGIVKSDPVPGT
jgi:sugar porter (SP) family MFS transporter